MKDVGAAIKVGITVTVIVVVSYLLFKRVHEGMRDSGGYHVYALFKDGAGLVAKSKVVIAGLPAGKINRRSISHNRARVDLFIDAQHRLYANAVIYKKSLSMMGEYYLELDPGTEYSPDPKHPTGPPVKNRVLKDGDQILHVVEATGVNDILPQVKSLLSTVDSVIGQDIRQVILALKKDLSDLVAEVKKLATGPVTDAVQTTNRTISEVGDGVNRLVKKLDRIAADIQPMTGAASRDVAAILGDVRAMTDRLRQAVASTDGGKPGLVDRVERIASRLEQRLESIGRKVDKAADDVPAITKNVKKITSDVADGKGVVGKFLTDEALAATVKDAVQDAGKFISGLTGLQTIVGLRSEYNVLSNSLKTYISIRLQPKEDKYYLIELIDDPRGKRTASSTVTRSDDPSKPAVTRTEEIKVTDDFRFSFMLAKKVAFATFRFGIKENTGGLGLDLSFFRDRFTINTDIFDFQANVFPRLKVSAAWMFYPRLHLVVGADDVLNSRARTGAGGGRDYFVGAMLMFNDQDLKSLLMFAGSALGAVAK